MPMIVPKLDDLTYDTLRAETLARIPVHTPEWTNFNASDPGVTLIELFSFMTENLLYRSNLIPERNRLQFLSLLGMGLQPATAARGMVTLQNPRGQIRTETVGSGQPLFAGKVPFRSENGLDVLPIEGKLFYKKPITDSAQQDDFQAIYNQLYASHLQDGQALMFYETQPLEPPSSGAVFPVVDLSADTVDGLWLALLARESDVRLLDSVRDALAGKVLTLGIMPALTEVGKVLLAGNSAETLPTLIFKRPSITYDSFGNIVNDVQYLPLNVRSSGNLLQQPGIVQIPLPSKDQLHIWQDFDPLEAGVGALPPSLEETDLQERLITWIRIQSGQQTDESHKLQARISWAGINAAQVTQRVRVSDEPVGTGNGEPNQTFALVNTPILPDTARITVNGVVWQQIDDLIVAGAELSDGNLPIFVYTLDRESGLLRFGDGAHGARPPRNTTIRASYDYGGGQAGNVGIGAIKQGPQLPAGLKVSNPLPTWGGDEAESVAAAEQRIPQQIRHAERLVTADDFRHITLQTPGVTIGRVEVLPLFDPTPPTNATAEGAVTVMTIPQYDPVQPSNPVPDRLFLETICQYLNPRRLITTTVHVVGAVYKPIWVSIGIDVVAGGSLATVREVVEREIAQFLSPLPNLQHATGWPLEKSLEALEIWSVAARVAGVRTVNDVLLTEDTTHTDRVEMNGVELPYLRGIAVQTGQPMPLAALRGQVSADEDVLQPVAVPVVPLDC